MEALDIKYILDQLPHRYPMLLVDRVLEMVPGKSIKAIKNVTFNEPFFMGHFPGNPVMPGVLILEALAQAAAIFSFADGAGLKAKDEKILYYFVGIDQARFRRPVVPGDQLILEAVADRIGRSMCKYSVRGMVDGREVASAKIMCAIRPVEK